MSFIFPFSIFSHFRIFAIFAIFGADAAIDGSRGASGAFSLLGEIEEIGMIGEKEGRKKERKIERSRRGYTTRETQQSEMFQWMFGKRLTPQEQLRKNQRQLERSQRELEREKTKLQQQEKKLIADIKKSAKQGQTKTMNIQARDLIRTRKQVDKFDKMKMQLQAISLRLQTIRSSNEMTNSMVNATRILNGLNNGPLNLSQLSKISNDFQKSMDMVDQKQEMVDDVMDDLMDDEIDEEDEEEINEVVGQVLDEIGIDLNGKLGDLSVNKNAPNALSATAETDGPARTAVAIGGGGGEEDELQARLNSLKKGT